MTDKKKCKKCGQVDVEILKNGLLKRHMSPSGQVCLGPKRP